MNSTALTDRFNKMIELSGRLLKLMDVIRDSIGNINQTVLKFSNSEDEFGDLRELVTFYTKILYLFIIFGTVGLALNVGLYLLIKKGTKQQKLSPKRYSLILSRTVSDGLTSLLTVIWAALDLCIFGYTNLINVLHVIQLSLSYWSATGSSLALAVVTFLAAKHPLYYRTKVTHQHCTHIVTAIWVVSIAVTTALVPIGGSVFFSHIADSCSQACQVTILTLVVVSFAGSFCSVPLLYLTILQSLCRRSSQCHSCAGVNQLQVNNYWKLGLSIINYTVFNCPFLLLICAAALVLGHPDDQRASVALTQQIFALRLLAFLFVSARTVVEPLLTLLMDYNNLKATLLDRPGRRSTYRETTINDDAMRMMPRRSRIQTFSTEIFEGGRRWEPIMKRAVSVAFFKESNSKETVTFLECGTRKISGSLDTIDIPD